MGVMRIIAGQARGRRILSVPKHTGVRPILARIRQSLFDILRPRVPGSCFLDLFAGTGAVGLEALSRGAQLVVFIEQSKVCLKAIEKNVLRLGFSDRAKILRGDATDSLSWVLYQTADRPVDLVFLGPPYVDREKKPLHLVGRVLENVVGGRILTQEAWVIAQHHKKETFVVPKELNLFRQIQYGDSLLTLFRMPKGGSLIEPS